MKIRMPKPKKIACFCLMVDPRDTQKLIQSVKVKKSIPCFGSSEVTSASILSGLSRTGSIKKLLREHKKEGFVLTKQDIDFALLYASLLCSYEESYSLFLQKTSLELKPFDTKE